MFYFRLAEIFVHHKIFHSIGHQLHLFHRTCENLQQLTIDLLIMLKDAIYCLTEIFVEAVELPPQYIVKSAVSFKRTLIVPSDCVKC